MTAPTVAVEWLLARAAVRADGLLHIVSRRDSGALNPMCGANPIRSKQIEQHATLATVPDLSVLCEDCASRAASIGGTIRDGVALLLGLSAAETTTRLLEVPVDAVRARRDHARQSPGDDLDQLVDSVVQRGIVAPIIVRRRGNDYEVIDGARRLYAAHVAGLASLPAIVRDANDADALLDGLVTNLHRSDLNPIDQAIAYRRALEQLALTQVELAQRLAISQSQVANTVGLLTLPAEVQDLIAAGRVGAAHARELRRLGDPVDQVALAREIATERLSVRDVAARRASAVPATLKRSDVATLLAGLLGAKVLVTEKGDRGRVVIDVPLADLDRVLEQVGQAAVPTAA